MSTYLLGWRPIPISAFSTDHFTSARARICHSTTAPWPGLLTSNVVGLLLHVPAWYPRCKWGDFLVHPHNVMGISQGV